ncbi:MAG: hypothetical protein ACYTXC_18685 [Nostoc sp.]
MFNDKLLRIYALFLSFSEKRWQMLFRQQHLLFQRQHLQRFRLLCNTVFLLALSYQSFQI